MSKLKFTFYGKTENGKLRLNNRRDFEEKLSKGFPNDRLMITVERQSKKRSTRQNAYLWGVVYAMIQERLQFYGWQIQGRILDKEDVHEMMKNSFLKASAVNSDTGEVMAEVIVSTTKLSTTEFMEYVDSIIQWAAEKLALVIPDPDQFIEPEKKAA